MSAIITEKFRRNNAISFLADVAAETYYVGIGRSQSWPIIDDVDEDDDAYTVEAPLGTLGDLVEVRNNLNTLIGVGAGTTSLTIPRIEPKTTRHHKQYNPFSINCFYTSVEDAITKYPCYVVVNNRVYICLKETPNVVPPYTLPDGTSISREPFTLGDDSVWLYIYEYSDTPSTPIDGNQFISVPQAATLDVGEILADIETATGNLVFGFTVLDGGTGFVSLPVVKYITESGAEITLDVTIDAGAITSVTYDSGVLPSGWSQENGYVEIGGPGANARVYPMIGPVAGFGAYPHEDLPSWYAGIIVDATEDIYGDASYIPYRQVSIIRNPEYEVGTADPEISLNCLRRLEFGLVDAPTTVAPNDVITQVATGAIAIADYYDSTNKYLYYHQNYDTGFIPFDVSTISIDATDYEPTALGLSEYVQQTGEVVFTENRKKITRASGQTEEITIILQF